MSQKNSLENLENYSQEILGRDQLLEYLDKGLKPNHYIGFEISGLVHLGTGLMSGIVVRELQKLGVNVRYFLADWHTWINNKFEGDRDFVEKIALPYFEKALRVSAEVAGAKSEEIEFIKGTDLYNNNNSYWESLVDISKNLTVSRVTKSTSIMGRKDSMSMPFAFMLYPTMQVADIFEMQCHIVHSGMDQRKVHVISREVAKKLTVTPLRTPLGNTVKPVSIHHRLLLGLQKPETWPLPEGKERETARAQMKMSKSIPGSAIFIHDSVDEINQKIKSAFCPEKEVEFNSVLEWAECLIFPIVGSLEIRRPEKFGGSFIAKSFVELKDRYRTGDLHPVDLKNNVSEALINILEPARDAFAGDEGLIAAIREKQSR